MTTNGQDALVPIVLENLDTMSIKEILLTARDLPKQSEAYTPLDNAIEKFVLENISNMIFGRKWCLHHSIPAGFKGRKILEDAIKKEIPNLTIGKKCDLWDSNPTERTKNYLNMSITKDILAKLEEVSPVFSMKEIEPDETWPHWKELEALPPINPDKILDIWDTIPEGIKARTMMFEFVKNMPNDIRYEYLYIVLDDILDLY